MRRQHPSRPRSSPQHACLGPDGLGPDGFPRLRSVGGLWRLRAHRSAERAGGSDIRGRSLHALSRISPRSCRRLAADAPQPDSCDQDAAEGRRKVATGRACENLRGLRPRFSQHPRHRRVHQNRRWRNRRRRALKITQRRNVCVGHHLSSHLQISNLQTSKDRCVFAATSNNCCYEINDRGLCNQKEHDRIVTMVEGGLSCSRY
jgi:hypothetical protein